MATTFSQRKLSLYVDTGILWRQSFARKYNILESNEERTTIENYYPRSSVEKKLPDIAEQDSKDTQDVCEHIPIAEGSLEGQVSCFEGPVQNVVVSTGTISAISDSKGSFLLEHVVPGITKVRAKSPSPRFSDTILDVIIEDGKRKNVFIFLSEVTGIVEGTITDEIGKPLVGVEISAPFRPGKDLFVTKSDEKGHYMFSDIPAGSYYIRARIDGYMTQGDRVIVTGGSNLVSNFIMKRGMLSITGKVCDELGSPLDSQIYLMRKGIVITKTKTSISSGGQYGFTDLIPDVYQIEISCYAHRAKSWWGKLEKNEVVNFELPSISEQSRSKPSNDRSPLQ